jgi:hypothetical protein
MKRISFCLLFVLAAISSGFAADEAKPATPQLNALEQKFKDLLTNATLDGTWHPIKEGEIGEEKKDKYTIISAAKVKGDSWVINAKMKYGGREMIAPIPVEVKWAGDTAVVIVNNLQIPGGGNYTARVLFFEKTYAGTWSGGSNAGLLSGTISNKKE